MDEDPVRASILNGEIIVIDDFFQNESSEFLRAYIDKLEYSEKANYAGKSVTLSEDDHQKVLVLFERYGIKFSPKSFSRLRLSLASDRGTEKRIVHTDAHTFAVVLFLSDPPDQDLNYGTDFFFNKLLQSKRGDVSNAYQALRHNLIIENQSLKMDCWEIWKHVQMKKDRAVIFPSLYYHGQSSNFFGTSQLDGRLSLDVFSY